MPGPNASLWKKALSLQDRGHALESLDILRNLGRKLARTGGRPESLMEVARRLIGHYDHAAALELLEAAARLGGQAPGLLARVALLLLRENAFAEAAEFAERTLKKSAAGSPEGVDARLLLAECRERQGRLDETLELTREVLAERPHSIPAHRLRATVLRRRGQIEEALAALRSLTERGGPAHWETCRAWFELGHARDAAGDYPGAWLAWHTARKHYPPDADWKLFRAQANHVWRQVRETHDFATPEHFRRWTGAAESARSPRRLAILTGHPRSGTTLLEQALDAHGGIVSAEETTVFTSAVYRPVFQHGPPSLSPAARLDALTAPELLHWRNEYLGLTRLALREEPGERLILDKNPDLLQLLPAVARIFPEAKIIVMLRDPRDLLVSMFAQALPPNHTAWSYRTVETAAKMIALRLGLWLRLRDMLPPEMFHETRYEDCVRDFPAGVGGVLDFLGLPPDERSLRPETHSRARPVISPTYAAVEQPVHTRAAGRWRRYEPGLRPALEILRPAAEALGYE